MQGAKTTFIHKMGCKKTRRRFCGHKRCTSQYKSNKKHSHHSPVEPISHKRKLNQLGN